MQLVLYGLVLLERNGKNNLKVIFNLLLLTCWFYYKNMNGDSFSNVFYLGSYI
jgi:hypothetical protein